MKVMVVDDELGIRLLVQTVVGGAGHECCTVDGGERALEAFRLHHPDVVVLDVMMPKVDGFEVCRRIRAIDDRVPVLFLSAKGDIGDKKIGFSNGGDDYLVKPFNEEELLMRIDALHRRAVKSASQETGVPESFELGNYRFDALRHQIMREGTPIPFTPKEFQLLFHLALHHGKVIGKEELIECAWGAEYAGEPVNIAVYIRKIREKIEDNPAKPVHLKTVWGVGYAFEA